MGQLFSQLGIEPSALLWQAANFLVVLVVLYFVVYRPLAKIVDDRRLKIEKGLDDARVADRKLGEIKEEEARVLAEAEKSAFVIMKEAEGKASEQSREIVEAGNKKVQGILKEAKTLAERRAAEEMVGIEHEAVNFVRDVLAKTVEMNPKDVDEKLVDQAVKALRTKRA